MRAATALRSVQTSAERRPDSGSRATGPPGMKRSCAMPWCGRSWPMVSTMLDCR